MRQSRGGLIYRLLAGVTLWCSLAERDSRHGVLPMPVDINVAFTTLTWRDFLKLVAAGFQQQGIEVVEGSSVDSENDVSLSKGSERFLVQWQTWRAGMLNKQAEKFAAGTKIDVIQRKQLQALLQAGRTRIAAVNFRGQRGQWTGILPVLPRVQDADGLADIQTRLTSRQLFLVLWASADLPSNHGDVVRGSPLCLAGALSPSPRTDSTRQESCRSRCGRDN